MASILSLISGLFGSKAPANEYQIAETYSGLRNMVLNAKSNSIGLNPGENEVWGVLMETGYSEAIVTLVALAEGTVSLYFSNGGGILGLGPHPGPQKASKSLISMAQKFSKYCSPTKTFPLPKPSYTRFYILTGNRIITIEAKEEDFGYNRNEFSPVFHKGHELISEIRKVDEQLRAEQKH